MFVLITQARNELIRWDMCHINPEVGPFWYLSSEKFHRQSVIIHIWRLLKCKMGKIWKMHWKLTIMERHYHFVYISATNALIFMKFYMVVNYYLVSLCNKFHEDPCKNARARVINARTCDKTCTCAFTTRACAFMHGYT